MRIGQLYILCSYHTAPRLGALFVLLFLSACEVQDPKPEDVPEFITKVTITFTPSGGPGGVVIVNATDPDNIGSQDIIVDGPVNLVKGTTYTLSIQLYNEFYEPNTAGYDVTQQIEKEAAEHQFFFSWNAGLFASPVGDGNIDNRSDPLNYSGSPDENGRPVGLITSWITAPSPSTGINSFRILLKHQPELKSDTSSSDDGETDLDLKLEININ